MHFEVKQVNTDKKSGFTRIVISYDFGKGEEIDEMGFSNPDQATYYINTMKRDYLKKMIELYVMHSKHIFENSKLGYYQETSRMTSLQRCLNALKVIAAESSLKVICGWIFDSEVLFRHILPHFSNNSAESSEERLNVIVREAKQYLISIRNKSLARSDA